MALVGTILVVVGLAIVWILGIEGLSIQQAISHLAGTFGIQATEPTAPAQTSKQTVESLITPTSGGDQWHNLTK